MAPSFSLCFQIIVLFLGYTVCNAEFSCRNEEGEPVDWFIIYKLPRHRNVEVGSGVEYMYLDSSVKTWQMSKFFINSSQGALGNTVNQLYKGKAYESNSSVYAFYNDGPPDLDYIHGYGHTKGVLLFDRSQGFWLLHSVPHFPSFPERGYLYPSSGKVNGQTALCVTYQYDQFLHIDIYTGWVAQVLGTDLLVESWQSQGHELPSNCSLPKHTMNIKRIRLPSSVRFWSRYDHSKWCVSHDYKVQVTCLGDLNRAKGQLWCGGGLVCSFNPVIYKAFRQLVDFYINC
ncbi:deoxyribonuclease-2-beta isoform 3-T3 [Pholidichthys leucotaenia]